MTDPVTINVAGAAEKASAIVKDVMKVEPMVVNTVGMFVPGAAPVVALVQPVILAVVPFIERALDELAQGHNGDALAAFFELIQHLTKNMPNSPTLSPQPQPQQDEMKIPEGA